MSTEYAYFLLRDRGEDEIYLSGITENGNAAFTHFAGETTRRKTNHPTGGRPPLTFPSARDAYEYAAQFAVLKYWRAGRRLILDEKYNAADALPDSCGVPMPDDENEFDQSFEE